MGRFQGLVAVGALVCAAPGCQQSAGPVEVGVIACSIGQRGSATASATDPCQVSIDFGQVAVGAQSSVTFDITNPASSPLTFGYLTGSLDPAFFVAAPQQPLPPHGSGIVTVTYAPGATGSNSSTVDIPTDPDDAEAGPLISIQLSGTGFASSLSVDATALDFGNVVVNSTQQRSVTLTNGSPDALDGITFELTGESSFFSATGVPTSLAAGASAVVTVTYAPLGSELVGTEALVFSASGASVSVALTGAAISQALSLAPAIIDFGFVQPKATNVGCTEVSNQSGAAIHITGMSNFDDGAGAFQVSATDDATPPNPISYPITVQGGQSARVCFAFSPSNTQSYSGQAGLANDVPSAAPVVQLTGFGGGPQISCSPSPLDFGIVILGTSVTLPLTCTNSGTPIASTNLTLGQPRASPSAFSAEFDSAHPYSAAGIVAGESVDIDVTFTPGVVSVASGTLTIPNNGGQSIPLQVTLTATVFASACEFNIAPPALEFGNSPLVRAAVKLGFEIQNTGTVPCLISIPTIQGSGGAGFQVTAMSVAPDPQTRIITLPPQGAGDSPNLDVDVAFVPTTTALFDAEAAFSIGNASQPKQTVSLSGSSQSSCLVVAPSTLDFGSVAFADGGSCAGPRSLSFTILNHCLSQSATLSAVALQAGIGDSVAQFTTPEGPSTPATLFAGSEVDYSLSFAATSPGAHTGQVLVSDGTVTSLVMLTGNAVDAPSQTDNFTAAAPKVDVLFQMDSDALESPLVLAALFDGGLAAFVKAGKQVDYRIAVTTDDDESGVSTAEAGRLLPCPRCSVVGASPEIISSSTVPAGGTSADPAAALVDLLSSIPTGLGNEPYLFQSLFLALEPAPINGVDFFRPDAEQVAIVVSGQDDNSPLPMIWYEDFFEAPFNISSSLIWNYVGTSATVDGTGLMQGSAQPTRIRQMRSTTGGIALNTSDPAWVGAIAALWPAAPVSRYPLSATPVGGQAAITVSQNGVEVPQTGSGGPSWTYDSLSNTVAFTASQPLASGDQIAITYSIGCQ